MDINANFAFELTNINGYLTNMDLIKQKNGDYGKEKAPLQRAVVP
ncbi:hypothetical protein [Arsenophonus endosymbiont of Aleurodicus floccissimus]|nr:hypothetical protein [Arsenophonus endosymbiont of Aleurodicus floccissimus]